MNTPPPPRCATCAYYTPVTLSNGLCQPPAERGGLPRRSKHGARRDAETGEPFAIQCSPHFIACHIYRKNLTTK